MTPPKQQNNLLGASVLLTVWDEAWYAISSPKRYVVWAFQPFRRSFSYLTIICVLAALVATIYATLVLRPQVRQAGEWFRREVPQVSITDGLLTIEGDKTYGFSDNQTVFVRVDTSQTLAESHVDAFYQQGVVAASDGLLIWNNGRENRLYFAQDLGRDVQFTGEQIADYLSSSHPFLIVAMFLAIFIYLIISKLVISAFGATLTWIASGMRLNLEHLWSMALYAHTPAMLVSYILYVLYPVPYLPTAVFLLYLGMATHHYRRFLAFRESQKAST